MRRTAHWGKVLTLIVEKKLPEGEHRREPSKGDRR